MEEQVRAVTAQRRQAERAAAEVLAVLESQGFGGHLSDVADDSDDSGHDSGEEDDGKRGGDTAGATGEEGEEEEPSAAKGEAEDALSGTAQPGGLSWKGRSVSPRKARQLKQKHRRSYFYLLSSSDPSPKYRVGQSCRKNKRRVELRCGLTPESMFKFHPCCVFLQRSFLCSAMSSGRWQRKMTAGAGGVRNVGKTGRILRTMAKLTWTARWVAMSGVQGPVVVASST